MTSNGTRSFAWRLYVIVDPTAARGRRLDDLAATAIRGGADAIQLRDKTATTRQVLAEAARLLAVTRPAKVPLLINDRADVAAAVGADGVHLGQDDLPVRQARRLLGASAIIGLSTHSLAQAQAALEEPVDYLGLGPIFPTPTKPGHGSIGVELICPVRRAARCPVVCIGGVDAETVDRIIEAGGACVAVVRAVCAAADPETAARALASRLTQLLPSTPPDPAIMFPPKEEGSTASCR